MNRLLVPVFALLVLPTVLAAQLKTLTMEQAVQIALERNLSVIQAQNSVDAANASLLAAKGEYLPSLSASGGWSRRQTETKGQSRFITGGYSAGLDANLTIFDGLRREAGLSGAGASAALADYQAARARQSAVYQVQAGYLNVLRNEQLVKVSEENLKRDQRQLERITESNRVGALSLADVYRQQSQVSKDELDVITTRNDFDKARADLLALIGLDAAEDRLLVDSTLGTDARGEDLKSQADAYRDMAALVQRAYTARPDYLGAKENYNAATSGITAARSGYLPSLSAFAGYGLANEEFSKLPDVKTANWGLSLSWTLFDNFQTNRALQQASVESRNAEVALHQAELDISAEVRKTMLNLEASRKALEVTQKGLKSAQEDRRIAEERYNLGAGTLLDLLVGNAGLVNAEASQVNATYAFIISLRQMEFTLGEQKY